MCRFMRLGRDNLSSDEEIKVLQIGDTEEVTKLHRMRC
jgi:hypothetical protein